MIGGRFAAVVGVVLLGWLAARAETPVSVKPIPENIEDLKALQKQVKRVLDKVVPCTVGIRIGPASGSGVIINKDGYVLTAGHVSGKPDRDVTIILHDGRKLKGKTLGANLGIDSGLIKITEDGDWPCVDMGKSKELTEGQWCIAIGHPGGFRTGRTPVVRVGRVLQTGKQALVTDCTLVGGDSGGPLFDLNGKVIGIHSRIGGPITANVHVPVDSYRATFDRLAKSEVWGGRVAGVNAPFLGIQADPDSKECKIAQVLAGSPADQAGLKANDVVTKFDGRLINSFEDLGGQIVKRKPGDAVLLEIRRGEETKEVKVVLGKRG